jgi:hypothetical protein
MTPASVSWVAFTKTMTRIVGFLSQLLAGPLQPRQIGVQKVVVWGSLESTAGSGRSKQIFYLGALA